MRLLREACLVDRFGNDLGFFALYDIMLGMSGVLFFHGTGESGVSLCHLTSEATEAPLGLLDRGVLVSMVMRVFRMLMQFRSYSLIECVLERRTVLLSNIAVRTASHVQ